MSSQDVIEIILRDAAIATGIVDPRFGHRVTEVVSGWRDTDDEAAVAVSVPLSGETYTLTGEALVSSPRTTLTTVDLQHGYSLFGPVNGVPSIAAPPRRP